MNSQYKFKFYLNASHSIEINGVTGERHPHTWEIAIWTKQGDEEFVAFHEIEKKMEELLEPYQDGYLNQLAPFDTINPTLENCCIYFQQKIGEILQEQGWKLHQIEMSETPTRSYIINMISTTF